jgi:hypothetical protein
LPVSFLACHSSPHVFTVDLFQQEQEQAASSLGLAWPGLEPCNLLFKVTLQGANELAAYLELPQIKYTTEQDMLDWWKKHQVEFPNVALMASI